MAAFAHWLRTHTGAVAMAGLLSFAVPATLFPGAVSAMSTPTPHDIVEFTAWLLLLALELWLLLLAIGYALQQLRAPLAVVSGATLMGASIAAGLAEFSNGRGHILVDQGVAESAGSMHAYSFVCSLVMAILFFAHLHRSRAGEQAAERLAAAQAAQRQSRRRLVQTRLQALQARIDPQLLFDMLDEVRRAYEHDATRAERLLDELVAFLRVALPRLRMASSSVGREVLLARSYAQLRRVAGACAIDTRVDVQEDVACSRFPPGVLLPLVDEALRARPGMCELSARRDAGACELVLQLPAPPTDATVARVRALLSDIYGQAAELSVMSANGLATATFKVPYEHA
jgi:hypothetical protein